MSTPTSIPPHHAGRGRPRASTTVGAIWCLVAGWQLLRAAIERLTASSPDLVTRLPDDAFYYLGIARSIAAGNGPRFDGIHATNGFHPLWQWITAALALLWSNTALVRSALLAELVAVAATWVLMARLVRPAVQARALAVGAIGLVLTCPPALTRLVDGMETAVAALTTTVAVTAAARYRRAPTGGSAVLLGAAAALAGLARLSALPVMAFGVLALLLIDRSNTGRRVRHVVSAGAAAAVVLVPWIVTDLAATDQLLPVSAQVKRGTEGQLDRTEGAPTRTEGAVRAINEEAVRQADLLVPWHLIDMPTLPRRATTIALGAGCAVLALRPRGRRHRWWLLAPGAVVGARFVLDVAAVPRTVPTWYGGALVLTTAGIAATAVAGGAQGLADAIAARSRNGHRTPWRRWLPVAAVLAIAPTAQGGDALPPNWARANLEAANALPRIAPGTTVGAFDAGLIGWLVPGTRNLDGLVREPGFVGRWTPDPETAALLRAEHIDVLVDIDDDVRLPDCARRLWTSTTGPVPLRPSARIGIFDTLACGRGLLTPRDAPPGERHQGTTSS